MNSNKIYDLQLRKYIEEQNGAILVVSNDNLFSSTVKGIPKAISTKINSIETYTSSENILKNIKKMLSMYKSLIVCLEATIDGNSTLYNIPLIKNMFSNVYIICVSPEASKENIALMMELGADKIIIKPISFNSLVEKIALTLKPNNKLSIEIEKAKVYLEKNLLLDAKASIDIILKEKPDSATGLILKGMLSEKENKLSDAELYYKTAIDNNKLYIEPIKKLIELYGKTNQINKQLEQLLILDKISPLNYTRKIDIGEIYAKNGEKELANNIMEEAIKMVKKQSDDLVSSAYMKISQKLKEADPEKSLELAKLALDCKNNDFTKSDVWMFNEIGLQLRKQGKWEEALNYYRKAEKVSPADPAISYNIGVAYFQGKKYIQASQEFDICINKGAEDILKSSEQIAYNIALAFYMTKQFNKAQIYNNIAISLNANYKHSIELEKFIEKYKKTTVNI